MDKRQHLYRAIQFQILYTMPACIKISNVQRSQVRLQRKIFLRCFCGHITIFLKTIWIMADLPPIFILPNEQRRLCRANFGMQKAENCSMRLMLISELGLLHDPDSYKSRTFSSILYLEGLNSGEFASE